jgi:hypothetical protein
MDDQVVELILVLIDFLIPPVCYGRALSRS